MDMKKLLATVLLMSSTVAFSQEQRIKEPERLPSPLIGSYKQK